MGEFVLGSRPCPETFFFSSGVSYTQKTTLPKSSYFYYFGTNTFNKVLACISRVNKLHFILHVDFFQSQQISCGD